MEDILVGVRRGADSVDDGDPLTHWRHAWEQAVAAATPAAESRDSNTDLRLSLRRRDYGSYLFVAIDCGLAVVVPFVMLIPPILVALGLFLATRHGLYATGNVTSGFTAWLMAPAFLLVETAVPESALLLVLWYRLRRLKLDWSTIGLGFRSFGAAPGRASPGRAVLYGVGIGALALLVSDILTNALQNVGLDQTGQYKLVIEPLRHSPLWIVLALVAAATLVAPVVEEAFFRGYIFRAIAVRKGLAMAYPISAGAFALNHFFLGGPDILPLVPVLFVIGLMLCFAYRRTGNLLCDITAHALNNGATFALALLPIHLPF